MPDNMKDELESEINSLHIEMNSIKLSLEELKEENNDLKRKEHKHGVQIDDIQKNMKKVETKLENDNENNERQFK